jgi:hypothetical protein
MRTVMERVKETAAIVLVVAGATGIARATGSRHT